MLVIFHQPRVGVVTRLWAHGVRQTTWRRNCFPEWTKSDKVVGGVFTFFAVRRSESRRYSLYFGRARRIYRAPLSIEDANMTAFFPPTWSRDPARYLMEKYWLWCVVEPVHNPGKSFREDFRRAFELLPSNTALTLFFVRLSNDHAIWSRAMGFGFGKYNCKVIINPAAPQLHKHIVLRVHSVPLSCMFLCNVRVLGSAWHFRQLAYIRCSVINKRSFKAYYLCVHSWMAFTRAHMHAFNHRGKENTLLDTWAHFLRINQLLKFSIRHYACRTSACKMFNIFTIFNLKLLESKCKAVRLYGQFIRAVIYQSTKRGL